MDRRWSVSGNVKQGSKWGKTKTRFQWLKKGKGLSKQTRYRVSARGCVILFKKKYFRKKMPKKVCAKCNRDLSVTDYNPTASGASRSACKRCETAARAKGRSNSPYSYISSVFSKLKYSRAKEDPPILWEISVDYVKQLWDLQKGKCALSDVFLTWQANEGKQDFNVSIDRIDSKKGYMIGNIQLVAQRVNVMKHTLGESEFYWWCKNIITKKEEY